jgi:hypothetical protein
VSWNNSAHLGRVLFKFDIFIFPKSVETNFHYNLIEVNQRDDNFDGVYLYYATLHVSAICPSSAVYKEITICVISGYRLYVWGNEIVYNFTGVVVNWFHRNVVYRGCG